MSQYSDINNIAVCHRLCFGDSLSSKLGINYSKKTFEWFLAGENRFLFHVLENDILVGYCGGFYPRFAGDGSTSDMIQYAMKEAVKGTLVRPWLFFHKEVMALYPVIFKNVYRKIFTTKNKAGEIKMTNTPEKRIGLVVIGVHPSYRGKGVFEILMNQFENETLERKFNKMVLSVKKKNTRAINAYKKMGWSVEKENNSSFEMAKLI